MAREIPKEDLVIHGVPKPILTFVERYTAFIGLDPQKFWQQEIISAVDSLITCLDGDYFDRDTLLECYGLKAILELEKAKEKEERH